MESLLAQTTVTTQELDMSSNNAAGLAMFSGVWMLFWLAVAVISIIGMWKMFEKAGEAGWKSIIPLYNVYVLCQIAGRNGWWMLGLLVPFVNIVVSLIIMIDLAKHFGQSTVFGVVALWLFSPIGYMILGFGDAKYLGPKHA